MRRPTHSGFLLQVCHICPQLRAILPSGRQTRRASCGYRVQWTVSGYTTKVGMIGLFGVCDTPLWIIHSLLPPSFRLRGTAKMSGHRLSSLSDATGENSVRWAPLTLERFRKSLEPVLVHASQSALCWLGVGQFLWRPALRNIPNHHLSVHDTSTQTVIFTEIVSP